MKKTLLGILEQAWLPFAVWLAAIAGMSALLLPRIGSIPASNTVFEQPGFLKVLASDQIVENILFAPHKVLQFALVHFHHDSILSMRLVSVLFAMLAISTFFLLMCNWTSRRVALLGTLLFASSSWMLHKARWAEPDVMYLYAIPFLLLAGLYLKQRKFDVLLPLTTLLAALCLYLPGLWIFVFMGTIYVLPELRQAWKRQYLKWRILWLASFVLPVLPLIYSLTTHPSQLRDWLGLPEASLLSASYVLERFSEIPRQLLLTGPEESIQWLHGTPVLDIASLALVILGAYYCFRERHNPMRNRLLIGIVTICIVFISLGGSVSLSILMPVIYIFATLGLGLLLQQWFHVFPRNPVARSVGLGLACLLVLAAITYQTTRYYIAWPKAETTKQIFNQ